MLNAEGLRGRMHGGQHFHRQRGQLLTPPLSAGALYGITRGWSWSWPRQAGVAVSEPNLTRYDLFNAEECFLTGTGAEIIAVVKIDGRVIGTGKPGPVTRSWCGNTTPVNQSSGEPIYMTLIRKQSCRISFSFWKSLRWRNRRANYDLTRYAVHVLQTEPEAKVHLTQIVGDKMQKVDLCEECAKPRA
jgi:hypothetical protein